MFASTVIEVVIGLVFVFSLMAILVTYTNSIISTALNLRAKQLKQGLQDLLTDPDVQAKVLAHPLINMVNVPDRTAPDLNLSKVLESDEANVQYIDPTTFVDALVNVLVSGSDDSLFNTLRQAIDDVKSLSEKLQLRELLQDLRTAFSEQTLRDIYDAAEKLEDETTRKAILDSLAEIEATAAALRFNDGELVPLLESIQRIDDPRLRNALNTIVSAAQSVDEAKSKLESWFNERMGRVSSEFSKVLQRYSLIVALVIALFFNVDTIYLAQTLYVNDDLRAEVVTTATLFDETQFSLIFPEVTTTDQTSADDGAAAEGDTSTDDDGATLEELNAQITEAQVATQTLLDMQLPIGWVYQEIDEALVAQSLALGLPDPYDNARNAWNLIPGNSDGWLWLVLQKIAGILVTTIAAAQGAPFWFDLLRRLTTRRSDN